MLLIALLHALSQDPPPPSAIPPPPVPIPSLPASPRERRPEFEIGRSSAGNLIYHGPFTLEGVEALRSMIRPNDTVVVSGGGNVAAGLEIARIINAAGGLVRVGGMGECYAACAALATVADRFLVPFGATVLFTRTSLIEADNKAARALAACIPTQVPDRRLVWLAPEVIASAGLNKVEIEWSLSIEARDSYERLIAGQEIAWIEACDEMRPAAGGSPT